MKRTGSTRKEKPSKLLWSSKSSKRNKRGTIDYVLKHLTQSNAQVFCPIMGLCVFMCDFPTIGRVEFKFDQSLFWEVWTYRDYHGRMDVITSEWNVYRGHWWAFNTTGEEWY